MDSQRHSVRQVANCTSRGNAITMKGRVPAVDSACSAGSADCLVHGANLMKPKSSGHDAVLITNLLPTFRKCVLPSNMPLQNIELQLDLRQYHDAHIAPFTALRLYHDARIAPFTAAAVGPSLRRLSRNCKCCIALCADIGRELQ